MQGLCRLLNALAKGPAVGAQLGVTAGRMDKEVLRKSCALGLQAGAERVEETRERTGKGLGINSGSWHHAGLVR